MSDSIRVSEKHGLNPSLGLCFWCGKPDGTVVLVGRLKGDVEGPKYVNATYEPCDECSDIMSRGVLIVEAEHEPNGNMEIAPDSYPTGRWLVVKDVAIERITVDPDLAMDIIRARKCLVDPEVFGSITRNITPTPQGG